LTKMRLHELSKELNVDSKKVIDYLNDKGIEVKNHMSTLDSDQEAMVRKAFAAKEEKAEAPKAAKPEAAAEGQEAPKKKKRLIAVFHPQNATSKEGKNFRQGANQSSRSGRPSAQGRAAQGGEKAPVKREERKTPLVKVPRPHPAVRSVEPVHTAPKTAETPKPVQAEAPKTVPAAEAPKPVQETAPKAAPAAEASKPVQEAAPKTVQAEAVKRVQETAPKAAQAEAPKTAEAPKAAQAEAPAARTENRERTGDGYQRRSYGDRENGGQRPYGDRSNNGQRSYGDRNNGQRPYGDRSNNGQRPYGDRNNGQRPYGDRSNNGQRPYGDRSNNGQRPYGEQRPYGDRNNGQRPYGDRNNNGQRPYGDRGNNGQRPYGDRNNNGQRPYGDRNNRPGYGAQGGRPGFGGQGGNRPGFGSRTGFGRQQDKDKDEDGPKKFESRRNNQHAARPAAGGDMGLKKPTRDIGHSKDKDKSKNDLRENKFTNDRSNGGNSRSRNNQHALPKALQRPVHRKEEKKEEKVTEIQIPEKMTIRELAEKMKMQPSVIVKDLFMKGEIFTVNQEIDYDKAEEIAMTYDILVEKEEVVDVIEELLKEDEEDEDTMVSRPPVVCVMGHVDHGKTSLLDAIRHAHVTDREAGGITQNIGAYGVKINGRKITFLDTPGHEAFTAMRMRGANSTDIAVLVVAADDGVMPQTIEAINHAKAAGVEVIVAVNKIDKPGANVDRVKQELTEYELIPTDWGGTTEFIPVSAKTKEGIDDLLETILLTADILELKANPNRKARALVLEAKLDKGKGPVANILVQKGTLHVGDYIACGAASGKVRAMMDENSRRLKEAGPSTPVEVLGLNDVPNAGEILVATDTDKEAKSFAATFISESKNKLLEDTKSRMSLDALFSEIQTGNLKELNLIVKADVQGSVEALKQSLLKLSNEEVAVKIIHGGVGAINESDVTLAAASSAIIIGFNVRPDATAKSMAEQEKVDIRLYRVIYQAIEDIEAAMKGMLDPIYEEKVIGHAEIRQLFKASGVGTISGSYVTDGMIQRGCKVRIYREGKQIFEGELASLKRYKDDVKEVKGGYECGLVFTDFDEVRELDTVEAYIMVEVPRK